ncbi:MAG: nicotinate-nucleotide adenylyltransferase [Candidatus Electryoneaceae bacterium]|nr:nicotinate-nucleotide adenylyltransferase [Candidatus Electryoneaceae bacterium]
MRIGIFGGSFDPPHIGHFICARAAAELLNLDKVLVIPTAVQPHKKDRKITPSELRWEMVCASVTDDPIFEPSRIELDRGGLSYTVDTARELSEQYPSPDNELFLLIGSDSLANIDHWKQPDRLFSMVEVVAIARRGMFELSSPLALQTQIIETPIIEICSTEIRKRIADRLPIKWLVPAGVEEIIQENDLYRLITNIIFVKSGGET